jgi:hypothetical protein
MPEKHTSESLGTNGMRVTKIISCYHHHTGTHYMVIAICQGAFYIYNANFVKSKVARNLAESVKKRGEINLERWRRG